MSAPRWGPLPDRALCADQAVALKLAVKRRRADSELLGGVCLVSAVQIQHYEDVLLLDFIKRPHRPVVGQNSTARLDEELARSDVGAMSLLLPLLGALRERARCGRLKELEAYKELAAKVGQVHVVLGEGGLTKLELTTKVAKTIANRIANQDAIGLAHFSAIRPALSSAL